MLMKLLQLNVQKQCNVQHSVLKDARLKEYAGLVVSEPLVFETDGKVTTSPMGHQGWTPILPSERRDARWVVRSTLWVRGDIEREEVSVPSADLTVPLLRLPDRSVAVASVYVEEGNAAVLNGTVWITQRGDTKRSTPRSPTPGHRFRR